MFKKIILLFFLVVTHFVYSQNFQKDLEKVQAKVEQGVSVNTSEYQGLIKKYEKEFSAYPDEATQIYFYLGNSFYLNDKSDDAILSYNSAYQYSLKAKDTTLKYLVILTFARISNNMGDYQKAEDYYRYALPGLALIYGQSSLDYTSVFMEYIRVLINMERYNEALPLLASLESYFKTLNMENHPMYLMVIGNQGYIYNEQGLYNDAIAKYEYVLEGDKLIKNGDTLEHIVLTTNMAESYREMGEYDLAIKYQQNAKRMMQQYHVKNPAQSASIENNLGLIYKSTGNYKASEEAFNNAIYIYKQNKLNESEEYCSALSNKADLMRWLSRREEGLKLLSEALNIRKSKYGTNSENYANALSNYGLILYEDRNINEALTYFEEATKIYEGTVSKKHQSYANSLNNLSACYLELGKLQEAEKYKLEAIKIIEETLGKNHFRYISFLVSSWDIYVQKKEYEKGAALLKEARELALKKFGKAHSLYLRANFNLAVINTWQKNYKEAIDLYTHVLDIQLQNINTYFFTMNKVNQMSFLEESQINLFYFSTTLFNYMEENPKLDLSTYTQKMLNYQLIVKSLLNKSTTQWQKSIAQSSNAALKEEYQKWLKLRNALNDLYKMDFSLEEQESLIEDINTLETNLKKQINVEGDKFLTFSDIRNTLKPNELAVEIISYNYLLNDTTSIVKYAALCTNSKNEKPTCVLLNSNKFNEAKDLEYYNSLMNDEKLDSISYEVFAEKLFGNNREEKKIYISAQGVYNKVNFNSLYNKKSKKYLIDEFEITYLASLSAIKNFTLNGNSQLTAELFGNPDFTFDFRNNKATANKEKSQQLAKRYGLTQIDELPGTETEINGISKTLELKKWKYNLYKKKDANEENLRKVQSPKLLHIATHGYFIKDIETEDKKFLGFNSEAFSQLADLKSGLIMAGAAINTNDTVFVSAEKDGIFTAREASQLNLTNTDLVVLSACQTGLGFDFGNQGVIGLQQALSNAGAKNLIMSLWPVDDNATQLLMTKFYEAWSLDSSNKNIAPAFRLAQNEVKKVYKHPYYWGAFVLFKN